MTWVMTISWIGQPNTGIITTIMHMQKQLCGRTTYVHIHYLMISSFSKFFMWAKEIYETLWSAVWLHPFFNEREIDCCEKETIGLDVKLLMALKVNAYGIAANVFCGYCQMGESTAHKCCECFNEAILKCKELTSIFLWKMTKADAQRVTKLHFSKHGIHGMLRCIDCMHVVWKNYPVALQGAFTGKKACQH